MCTLLIRLRLDWRKLFQTANVSDSLSTCAARPQRTLKYQGLIQSPIHTVPLSLLLWANSYRRKCGSCCQCPGQVNRHFEDATTSLLLITNYTMDPIDEGVATPPSARGDVTVLRRAQTCIKPYTARSHITEPATCRKMRQSGGVGEAVKVRALGRCRCATAPTSPLAKDSGMPPWPQVFVRIKPLTSEDLAKHQGKAQQPLGAKAARPCC